MITTVDYADIDYHDLDANKYVKFPSREAIVDEAIKLLRKGQVWTPICLCLLAEITLTVPRFLFNCILL